MNLLIAEKPSVAMDAYKNLLIKTEGESFQMKDGYLLGKNWTITWCYGHLVGLSMPGAYGWDEWKKEYLPMIPKKWKFDIIPSSKKQFNVINNLIDKSNIIVNGGDAGREGELIVRLVLKMCDAENKTLKRLWVNSFVMEDLIKGWNNLKSGKDYENLYRAALSRSIGDWIVGLNATRAYSLSTEVRGLSVGRVQTPTLSLIVQRDFEVENWKQKFYYQLVAEWKGIKITYFKDNESKFDRAEELDQAKSNCLGKTGVLSNITTKEKYTNPKKPFDLSELQKAANQFLGFKAADTLKYTQELYENKFVTYPRTDSEYLPENMKAEAFDILHKLCDASKHQYLKSKTDTLPFFNSKKVTDHYAIIPTGLIPDSISPNLLKIYNLIKNRFITAFGKPYVFDNTQIEVSVDSYLFKASFNKEKDKGYKSLFNDNSEAPEEPFLNIELNQGEINPLLDLEIIKKEVTKPKYFTEATLLGAMGLAGKNIDDEALKEAMKEKGLGTAATRASIIETLKKRNYLQEKGKQLISTIKGRELIKMVDDKISSPELTGDWEYKLSLMEQGKYDGGSFLKEINEFVKEIVFEADNKGKEFKALIEKDLPLCPKCKTNKLTINNYGFFCQDECGLKLFRKILNRKLSDQHLTSLITTKNTNTIKGFKNNDGVKFDSPLKLTDDFKIVFNFPEGNNDSSIKKECPKCGNQTVQIKPKGAFCNTEGCDFKIWRVVASKKLSDKMIYNLLENRSTGKLIGFKGKNGKNFKAELILNKDDLKTTFKF